MPVHRIFMERLCKGRTGDELPSQNCQCFEQATPGVKRYVSLLKSHSGLAWECGTSNDDWSVLSPASGRPLANRIATHQNEMTIRLARCRKSQTFVEQANGQ